MLIQRVNRTDPEQVFAVVENTSGQTLTIGVPICWDTGGGGLAAASVGLGVTIPATSNLAAFAGLPNENIGKDAGTIGLVQVYGVASCTVDFGAASVSAAGAGCGIANGLVSASLGGGYPDDATGGVTSAAPFIMVMDNDVSGPNAKVNVFVRAM